MTSHWDSSGETGRLTCGALKEGTKIRVQGLCLACRVGTANGSYHDFWQARSYGEECGLAGPLRYKNCTKLNVGGTGLVSSFVQGGVDWRPDNPFNSDRSLQLHPKLPGAHTNTRGNQYSPIAAKFQRDGQFVLFCFCFDSFLLWAHTEHVR